MADAAAGIGDVTAIPRDHVDVQVRDGLAGDSAAIKTDVVTVRPRLQLGIELLFDHSDEFHHRRLFGRRGVKPGRDEPPRDDQRMPGADGKTVKDRNASALEASQSQDGIFENGESIMQGQVQCHGTPGRCCPRTTRKSRKPAIVQGWENGRGAGDA